ncbi:MAG TPA: ABC transporter permease [Longimicrobiales bacterium]|nr:ABC transporter permease [Longimicrobiales bacterium]
MPWQEVMRVALSAVRANKLRSFLTMLGIIIGIAAVIAMVALGQGAQRSVEARLATLGTNVLTVRPGQQFMGGVDRGDNKMTSKDAEALARAPVAVAAVAPEMQRRLQVTAGGANANLTVLGTWPAYFGINNAQLEAGRLFTQEEERGRRRVAVLGSNVGDRLGGVNTLALIGQTVQIGGAPFEVVGVLQSKGDQGWMSPDEMLYIPLATAQFRAFGSDRVNQIDVQAVDEKSMDAATAEIDRVIRREHRIRPGDPSDVTIRNQTALLSTFQETTKTFSFLLAGIAAVSLLVGGIGIMNIMLVSVTERTKEIGIRKALGARRRDVLFQFVVEALVLCVAGGIIGLTLGAGGAYLLHRLAGWNTAVAPSAALLAIVFSSAIGIFFGMWPARRAAKLDPIVALRYE